MPITIPPLKRKLTTPDVECDSVWYSFFRTIASSVLTKQNANIANGPGGWDDFRFPATAVNPPGLVSDPTYDTTNVGFLFSAIADQRLDCIAQMPHAWKVGSNIHPHIHWRPTSNIGGNVEWQLKYAWSNNHGIQPAWTTTNVIATVSNSTGQQTLKEIKTTLGNIVPPSGAKESSIIKFQILRLGSNTADTYGESTLFDEFDIHYYKEKAGTDPEYPT